MSNVIMNNFKAENAKGNVDLENDTIYVSLVDDIFNASASDVLADIDSWADISATWESVGSGYTAGGEALTAQAVVIDDVNNRAVFSASDISWPASTIDAYGCAIRRSSDNLLISLIDFGGLKSSVGGIFDLAWNPNNGIMTLS
jgi:hypothetical protein